MQSSSEPSFNYEKLVLENVADIIVITDLDFRVQHWNHAAEKCYGIPAQTAIGQFMHDLVQFDFLSTSITEAFSTLEAEGCWRGEVKFTAPDASKIYLNQTVKYANNSQGVAIGILALGRDITPKKIAEEKLAQSEHFYRSLIAQALDTTLLLDAAGKITFCSPSITNLLGYEVAEIVGGNAFDYLHPEDVATATKSFANEIANLAEIKFILLRLRKKGGGWLWCMLRGNNLLSTPGVNAVVVHIHDDTPRKQATDALKHSQKRFRTLIRDLQVGVLLKEPDGRIVMTNNAMTQLFDLNEDEILGGKIWELYTDVIHEDGRTFLLSERPSFIAMEQHKVVRDVVMGVWHKGRKERVWILTTADPILDVTGKLINIVCSFIDITERKRLERKNLNERLTHQRQIAQATLDAQEAERTEIGKDLHDNIGQQLTTVKLFLDLAKTTANDETHEMINLALKGVSDVINEVRAISRNLVPHALKDLGFIDSVNDLVDSLHTAQPIAIELDYDDFDEAAWPDNLKLALFRIIQEQLNNIMKYAGARRVKIQLLSEVGVLALNIKDDGRGFEMGKVKRGLGLKNIINRAELLGGKAEVITAPGQGCEVKVAIPRTSCPVEK